MTHEQRIASGEGVIEIARRMINKTKALLKRPTNRNVSAMVDSVMINQAVLQLLLAGGVLCCGEEQELSPELEEKIQGRG